MSVVTCLPASGLLSAATSPLGSCVLCGPISAPRVPFLPSGYRSTLARRPYSYVELWYYWWNAIVKPIPLELSASPNLYGYSSLLTLRFLYISSLRSANLSTRLLDHIYRTRNNMAHMAWLQAPRPALLQYSPCCWIALNVASRLTRGTHLLYVNPNSNAHVAINVPQRDQV
jgi:hypothetical protein